MNTLPPIVQEFLDMTEAVVDFSDPNDIDCWVNLSEEHAEDEAYADATERKWWARLAVALKGCKQ